MSLKRLSKNKNYLVEFFRNGELCGSSQYCGIHTIDEAASMSNNLCDKIPGEMRITDIETSESICYHLYVAPFSPHEDLRGIY